jgi:hypothetical protein
MREGRETERRGVPMCNCNSCLDDHDDGNRRHRLQQEVIDLRAALIHANGAKATRLKLALRSRERELLVMTSGAA